MLLRLDPNQYPRLQKPVCCHCTTQQAAVRTRVELVAPDRQSGMLAVTPTNRYSCNKIVTTMLSRVCNLFRNRTGIPGPCPGSLPIRRTDLYRRQDSNLQPLQSRWSIRPIGILLYFFHQRTLQKRLPCCISQGSPVSSFLQYFTWL